MVYPFFFQAFNDSIFSSEMSGTKGYESVVGFLDDVLNFVGKFFISLRNHDFFVGFGCLFSFSTQLMYFPI